MLIRLKHWARVIKRDVHALYLAGRDPRVPWYAKALALCVAGYALSPIDLIPDFVPVLGYLDDIVIVPAGVPKAVVLRLNAEVNKALATPAVGDRLPTLGLQIAGGTPEQFAAHIRKEAARWADVVKRSGAKAE